MEKEEKRQRAYRGTSLIRTPPPEDPTVALCLGTCGDPRGVGVSYERGTPAGGSSFPLRRRKRQFIKHVLPMTSAPQSADGLDGRGAHHVIARGVIRVDLLAKGTIACEQRGNNLKGFKELFLTTKAMIWPQLS